MKKGLRLSTWWVANDNAVISTADLMKKGLRPMPVVSIFKQWLFQPQT